MKRTPDLFAGNAAAVRVGLCQVETAPWAIDANTERVLASLDEAGAQGAAIAILPECVLHGYGLSRRNPKTRIFEVAEPLDGPRLSLVREKARAHRMHVVCGFAELGATDRAYNSAALIGPDGVLVSVYRKVHCRPFESAEHEGPYVPGDRFEVDELACADMRFGLGTMICFDREIPETVRCLRSLGAQLVACPLACDTSDMRRAIDYADNEMITRCRAAENEVFIVVVNHSGTFNGGSFVVGPGGELLHQMGPKPGVVVLDLPIGAVEAKYHADPLGWMGWGYRRPAVYDRYLKG